MIRFLCKLPISHNEFDYLVLRTVFNSVGQQVVEDALKNAVVGVETGQWQVVDMDFDLGVAGVKLGFEQIADVLEIASEGQVFLLLELGGGQLVLVVL